MQQLRKSNQCNFSQKVPFVLTSRKIITKNQYAAPALSAHLMFRYCTIGLTKAIESQVPMRPSLVFAGVQTVRSYTAAETSLQSAHARHPVFQSGVTV